MSRADDGSDLGNCTQYRKPIDRRREARGISSVRIMPACCKSIIAGEFAEFTCLLGTMVQEV